MNLRWMLRQQYTRFARAIVELGFADICIRCGYDFTGMAERARICPECGVPHKRVVIPRPRATSAVRSPAGPRASG